MQPINSENEASLYEGIESPFVCIKCKQGIMTPVIEEGEPDYTDHYACLNCGFHDTIPTKSIITSQFVTALIGIIISTYLLINSSKPMLGNHHSGASPHGLEDLSLIAVSILFASGFSYVMYQASKGYLKRKAYVQPKQILVSE